MAVVVQRILIITLLIKILFVGAGVIMGASAMDSEEWTSVDLNRGQEQQYGFQTDGLERSGDQSEIALDDALGDPRYMQKESFYWTAVKGIFAPPYEMYPEGSVDRSIAVSINRFVWAINILLILEAVYFVWAKKYT